MAEDFEVGGPLPEESSNRTFVIAAAGLGALLVLSIVCLAVYALVISPRQRQASEATRAAQAIEIDLQNTAVAQTQTAEAIGATDTPEPTATDTPEPSVTPTQVVVLPSDTPTPFLTLPTMEPQTATAAAQATLAAMGGGGGTPTPTALPTTGFADEVDMPILLLLGGALLVVIFITRGLRSRSPAG
jgi:type II secretory pathway pseudopilin PulG